jgi:hypothetical protein
MRPHRTRPRLGNTLVITLLTIIGVVALIGLASERTAANRTLNDLGADRNRAQAAAETLAALIEAKLYELAADNTARLKDNLGQLNRSFWWNLEGFTDQSGGATTGLYLNGCALRWRVEPVKVMARTLAASGTPTGTFTVNSETDTAAQQQRTQSAGAGLFPLDPGYFHFRIVTEAYALRERNDTTVLPWQTPGTHTASVQAQRVLQLKDVNLFKYVIFYAAVGPTGDIEFHPGPDLHIQGAVHSNGAIYLGGGGDDYESGQYHTAASSGGVITIGTEQTPVNVTGIDGIFRMRKAGNHHMARTRPDLSLLDPYQVPATDGVTVGGVTMTGQDNLNGGTVDSSRISINGVPFTHANDSRYGLTNGLTGDDEQTHHDLVTDARNRDARVVRGIANVPSFTGYPLEVGREAGVAVPLRQFADGSYSMLAQDEDRFPGETSTVLAPMATDLPLFLFPQADGTVVRDIWPTQPTTAAPQCALPPVSGLVKNATQTASSWTLQAPALSHTYLPEPPPPGTITSAFRPHQALNDYFRWAIHGKAANDRVTGLTIRERGMQNQQWLVQAALPVADGGGGVTWVGSDLAQPPRLADYGGDAAQHVRAYAWWMMSNYVVYLGKRDQAPVDITRPFFEHGLAAAEVAGSVTALIAREDLVVDVRAQAWENANNYTTAQANLLTLDMGQVMGFLRTTPLSSLPPHTGSDHAYQAFNGLLYVGRALRYDTMPNATLSVGSNSSGAPLPFAHPLKTNGYHPLALPLTPPTGGTGSYPLVGMVGQTPSAIEVGTIGSWTVYPSTRGVRLANAADIDYGGVQSQHSDRRSGLTVVTPNACYLWGNYNTQTAADNKVTPCAVFADSVVALSSAWNDANAGNNSRPLATSTSYVTSFVINNMPTDAGNLHDEGSGGVHNVVRFLENWSQRTFTFRGSLVVLNRMRYSRSTIGAGTYYSPPNRVYEFNSDLLTGGGQPPFSLKGTVPTRVVSTVNILDN